MKADESADCAGRREGRLPAGLRIKKLGFRLDPDLAILSKQGGLVPNKISGVISGVGTNFGLRVHVLPEPNKQRARKPSILLS
jgi:hypothetical protein